MRNKDIIKQYVNTGNPIPEYQFNKLNSSLLKTYFRKRILSTRYLDYYEVEKLPGNLIPIYLNNQLINKKHGVLRDDVLINRIKNVNDDCKYDILKIYLKFKQVISRDFLLSGTYTEDMILFYIDEMVKIRPELVAVHYLDFLDEDRLKNFMIGFARDGYWNVITKDIDYDELPKELCDQLIDIIIKNNNEQKPVVNLSYTWFKNLTDDKKLEYIKSIIFSTNPILAERELIFLKNKHSDILNDFLNNKLKSGFLTLEEFDVADLDIQKKYIDYTLHTMGAYMSQKYLLRNKEAAEYRKNQIQKHLNEK